jgi:hypothetical protein
MPRTKNLIVAEFHVSTFHTGSRWSQDRRAMCLGRSGPCCRGGAATWAECSGGTVRSRRVSWGKPVFRLTASSQLAESLAWGRGPFQRDGTSTQAERRPD